MLNYTFLIMHVLVGIDVGNMFIPSVSNHEGIRKVIMASVNMNLKYSCSQSVRVSYQFHQGFFLMIDSI